MSDEATHNQIHEEDADSSAFQMANLAGSIHLRGNMDMKTRETSDSSQRDSSEVDVKYSQSPSLSERSRGNISHLSSVVNYVHERLERAAASIGSSSASRLSLDSSRQSSDSLPEICLDAPDLEVLPKLTDEYEVFNKFAKGGQGILSKARDKVLKRLVAIKSLRKEHLSADDIRQAFVREALITAQLDHPAIISIYSLLRDDKNGIHLSMKLLRGSTLNDYLENLQKTYAKDTYTQQNYNERIKENLLVFQKICEAISYAHSRHIIHCDLKPDNIMLGEYGEVFVMDWGLAKKIQYTDETGTVRKQMQQKLDGTPRFIPPEAFEGVPRDERADIFALGLILYEIVTLRRGYDGHSIKQVVQLIRDGKRNPIAHRFGFSINRDLAAIIDKATAYNPFSRYQTVQELIDDIIRLRNDLATTARPDNFPRKAGRYLRHHSKTVITMAISGWIAALLFLLLTFRRQEIRAEMSLRETRTTLGTLTKQAENRKYEELVGIVDDEIYDTARRFSEKLLSFSNRVNDIAVQASSFLDMKDPVNFPGALPIYPCEEVADRSTVFSKGMQRDIGLEFCSYQQTKNQDPEETNDMIRRMRPVARQLQQLVLHSSFPFLSLPKEASLQEQMAQCAENGLPVLQAFIILEDAHIQICYPGHNKYPEGFDAHDLPWYQDAKNAAKEGNIEPLWSRSYRDEDTGFRVLNCTVPIINQHGDFQGVCSIKLLLETIEKILLVNNDSPEYLLDRWLLGADGRILFHQHLDDLAYTEKTREPLDRKTPFLHPAMGIIFSDIFHTGNNPLYGSREFVENGFTVTYQYAFIERLNVFLLQMCSKERLLKHLEKLQADNDEAAGQTPSAK